MFLLTRHVFRFLFVYFSVYYYSLSLSAPLKVLQLTFFGLNSFILKLRSDEGQCLCSIDFQYLNTSVDWEPGNNEHHGGTPVGNINVLEFRFADDTVVFGESVDSWWCLSNTT